MTQRGGVHVDELPAETRKRLIEGPLGVALLTPGA